MTEDEMIKWAQFPGTPSADFNVVAHYEAQKRLIWIAQSQARQEVWKLISDVTKQNHDIEALSSYPGSGIRRKAING